MKKLLIVTSRDNISNFGILYTEKNKEIGKKRKMYEIYKIHTDVEFQGFDDNEKFNPIVVLLDSNSLI